MPDSPELDQEMRVPVEGSNVLVNTHYNTAPVAAQPEITLYAAGNTINVPIDEPEALA